MLAQFTTISSPLAQARAQVLAARSKSVNALANTLALVPVARATLSQANVVTGSLVRVLATPVFLAPPSTTTVNESEEAVAPNAFA